MKKIAVVGIVAAIILGGSGYLVFHNSSKKGTLNNTTVSSASSTTPSLSSSRSTVEDQTLATHTPTTAITAQVPQPTTNPVPTPAPTPSPTPATPHPMNVTIQANDTNASMEAINAVNGQTVNITFAVSTEGTYHGGLEFKSTDPAIDSGPIAEGSSKTVSFIATKSFKFTPFWYQSGVQKDYFVTVNVK